MKTRIHKQCLFGFLSLCKKSVLTDPFSIRHIFTMSLSHVKNAAKIGFLEPQVAHNNSELLQVKILVETQKTLARSRLRRGTSNNKTFIIVETGFRVQTKAS